MSRAARAETCPVEYGYALFLEQAIGESAGRERKPAHVGEGIKRALGRLARHDALQRTNDRVAPAAKFAPLMVVDVPPAVVPVFGEMVLIEGGGAPPPCFGKIVLSFFNAPGAEFK